MYNRLLVALDGSPSAEHALPAAVALSRLTQATIHLVRVHEPSPSAVVTRGRWDAMSRRHELECLQATAARLLARGVASVDAELVDGPAPVAIQREVAQRSADLVVMTDRGRSPLAKCLGSVSAAVLRDAQVPVLVMRATGCPADLSREPIFRNMLVAVEDPDTDAEVVHQAAELGRLGGGCKLWHARDQALARVYPYAHAAVAAVDAGPGYDHESSAEEQPSPFAQPIPDGILPNRGFESAVGEDPAMAIVRAIVANTFDLVAIPTGGGGSRHLAAHSLAQRVASASRLPIFICPTSWSSRLDVRISTPW